MLASFGALTKDVQNSLTAVPLSRELEPRPVQCGLGRGLLTYQAASSSIQPFGHNIDMSQKMGGVGVPFFLGVAGSAHLDASSRFATIEMGRKLGRGSAPFGERGWVPI